MTKKRLLLTLTLVAIVAAPAWYFRHDCLEGEITEESKTEHNKKTERHRQITTTSTTSRNWKGQCLLTVRTRYDGSGSRPEVNVTTITVVVFRMKPEPVTLIEAR